jgi:hypothetical protein
MPDAQRVWQLNLCGTPSIVTLHSKQMPMPHTGPLGWPVIDLR